MKSEKITVLLEWVSKHKWYQHTDNLWYYQWYYQNHPQKADGTGLTTKQVVKLFKKYYKENWLT